MPRHKKNPEVAAIQLKPTEIIHSQKELRTTQELPEPRDMKAYLGLSAEVAQDTIYTRNTRTPNGMVYFPTEPIMRTIDKFFIGAVGGPLYIDEPQTETDIKRCLRKVPMMKEQGHRYCYITPEMDLEEVLIQLEGDHRGVA